MIYYQTKKHRGGKKPTVKIGPRLRHRQSEKQKRVIIVSKRKSVKWQVMKNRRHTDTRRETSFAIPLYAIAFMRVARM